MPIAGIFALLLAAPAANTTATPVARPVVRVLMQTEGAFAGDRRMLSDIARQAREIWRPYADITFDLADERVRPSTALRLTITDRVGSTLSDSASLGWIEFVDGRPSNAITISATAAAALMKASRWRQMPGFVQRTFLIRAMARAIAHELGHYLLASRAHAAEGLMCGQLTADDIMQPRRSSLRLDRAHVEQLQREELLARRTSVEDGL